MGDAFVTLEHLSASTRKSISSGITLLHSIAKYGNPLLLYVWAVVGGGRTPGDSEGTAALPVVLDKGCM